ncbi:MAG TPA: hypothetical protein VM802_20620 [Chitinophaga sp.]|uniref:hypothetical protein n=1 Tax=Chitinophaga sp. TaxID=1869181 RepID=UPI002C53415A|nr:hypothetical protein [Chitinophaga sp.]HVI47294.1 hypothetical protein [Chitinophaga sp.]
MHFSVSEKKKKISFTTLPPTSSLRCLGLRKKPAVDKCSNDVNIILRYNDKGNGCSNDTIACSGKYPDNTGKSIGSVGENR